MNTYHQTQKRAGLPELLVFRGLLSDDLRFEPLGCYSTYVAPRRAAPPPGDYYLALYTADGHELLRQPATLTEPRTCSPLSPRGWLVEGRMPLHPQGAQLRFCKGERLIRSFPVAAPPELRLVWQPKKVNRRDAYDLLLEYSPPSADAYVKILYQWGEKRYMAAGLIRPTPSLRLRFAGLPGGDACRFIISYSSGLRTVTETTHSFFVPRLPAALRIVRPLEGAVFAPWHPIALEATVRDPQGDAEPARGVAWLLNGRPLAAGRLGCLQALPEGQYTLEARLAGKEELVDRCTFAVRSRKTKAIPGMAWDSAGRQQQAPQPAQDLPDSEPPA